MIYKQILEGTINLSFAREHLSSESKNINKVIVIPTIVVNMLERYLGGEISAAELSEWSSFILFSDVYVCPENEDEDKYESMLYVLQQLSSPEIDGEINVERVVEHVNLLNKLYQVV